MQRILFKNAYVFRPLLEWDPYGSILVSDHPSWSCHMERILFKNVCVFRPLLEWDPYGSILVSDHPPLSGRLLVMLHGTIRNDDF